MLYNVIDSYLNIDWITPKQFLTLSARVAKHAILLAIILRPLFCYQPEVSNYNTRLSHPQSFGLNDTLLIAAFFFGDWYFSSFHKKDTSVREIIHVSIVLVLIFQDLSPGKLTPSMFRKPSVSFQVNPVSFDRYYSMHCHLLMMMIKSAAH